MKKKLIDWGDEDINASLAAMEDAERAAGHRALDLEAIEGRAFDRELMEMEDLVDPPSMSIRWGVTHPIFPPQRTGAQARAGSAPEDPPEKAKNAIAANPSAAAGAATSSTTPADLGTGDVADAGRAPPAKLKSILVCSESQPMRCASIIPRGPVWQQIDLSMATGSGHSTSTA